MNKTIEIHMQRFEVWAEQHDLCLDQVFMSTDGVPDNPYEDERTRIAFGAWMTATHVSTNYIGDVECEPEVLAFFNGRRVFLRDGYLDTEMGLPPEPNAEEPDRAE